MTPPRPLTSAPEQRSASRIPAARVPSIQAVRIAPGDSTCTLVNISTSGLLVECTSKPRPGSAVTLNFVGSFAPATVKGRVARTIVASLGKDGVLHYMVGIAFDQPIELDEHLVDPDAVRSETPPPAETAPRLASRLQNRW
jgi:hypothetical protein